MEIDMARIAIATDSNSGITQIQAKELGVSVLPMPFMIDGETFYEDISLTQDAFYEKLQNDAEISTSQPSPEEVMKLWRELLAENEEVVHIPMSSGLSGSCQSAWMLSREPEFEGRVHVVNNQRISVTQRQSVLDARQLAKQGMTGGEIREFLEADKFNSSIYIMLDTLSYLRKGGRITPAAAALGTILRLKPVLTIQGEKLDAFAKARTTGQGKTTMLSAIKSDMESRFGGLDPDRVWMQAAYTYDRGAADQWKQEISDAFDGCEVHMDPLSLSVACHIGPGALAIACCQRIKL